MSRPKKIVKVETVAHPNEFSTQLDALVKELNLLPNACFMRIKEDDEVFQKEPLKGSHILGFMPHIRTIQFEYNKDGFTPFTQTKTMTVSEATLIDVLIPQPNPGESAHDWWLRFSVNDLRLTSKRRRCEMMGIKYIAHYSLARILDTVSRT